MAYRPGSVEHMRHYSAFAAAAYNRNNRMAGIPDGYILDSQLTNRNRAVYINPDTKTAVLALRGTSLKGDTKYGDLGSDTLLALNMRHLSSRFNNATRTAKQIEQNYPGYKYIASGHSLGGSQTAYVARRKGWEGVSYAGHTPTTAIHTDALTGLFMNKKNRGVTTHYASPLDPVSVGTWMTGQAYNVKPRYADTHSLKNYM